MVCLCIVFVCLSHSVFKLGPLIFAANKKKKEICRENSEKVTAADVFKHSIDRFT